VESHGRAFLSLLVAANALGIAGDARSLVVFETGDAGETLATAQSLPAGSVPLTEIRGAISTDTGDVDLYRIFVSDPASFSATTTNGDSSCNQSICFENEFDATLSLFDANGLGVYYNDDRAFGVGDSQLPAGNPFSPGEPGFYFLAIADDQLGAVSALDLNGLIFPLPVPEPFTDVVGPTGPGGGDPLVGWLAEIVAPDPRDYGIVLTGVVVPEPATGLLTGLGLLLLGSARRRRR
jgi:hypothetical protein